jgi:hypothetical protein
MDEVPAPKGKMMRLHAVPAPQHLSAAPNTLIATEPGTNRNRTSIDICNIFLYGAGWEDFSMLVRAIWRIFWNVCSRCYISHITAGLRSQILALPEKKH